MIAFYPGVVVPPCSSMGLTEAELNIAEDALLAAFVDDDDSWIHAGAHRSTAGVEARRINAPDPQTLIVWGVAEPVVLDGVVPEDRLPHCGGEPIGIS